MKINRQIEKSKEKHREKAIVIVVRRSKLKRRATAKKEIVIFALIIITLQSHMTIFKCLLRRDYWCLNHYYKV